MGRLSEGGAEWWEWSGQFCHAGASLRGALERREYRGGCVLEWRERWGGLGVGGVRIGVARMPEQCVYAEAVAGHLVRIH